jgi:hypothetical protein
MCFEFLYSFGPKCFPSKNSPNYQIQVDMRLEDTFVFMLYTYYSYSTWILVYFARKLLNSSN